VVPIKEIHTLGFDLTELICSISDDLCGKFAVYVGKHSSTYVKPTVGKAEHIKYPLAEQLNLTSIGGKVVTVWLTTNEPVKSATTIAEDAFPL
jgi:hypothetical protein